MRSRRVLTTAIPTADRRLVVSRGSVSMSPFDYDKTVIFRRDIRLEADEIMPEGSFCGTSRSVMNWNSEDCSFLIPRKPQRSTDFGIRSFVSIGVAVLIAGALLFLVRTGLRVAFAPSGADSLGSSKAPAWELRDPDGNSVKSSDFDSKVVILNFSATWCPPGSAEIPGFIELQEKYGQRGLVVVGVLLDEQGPAAVKKFMKEFGINYPVVMGASNIAEYFGGAGIPSTFIINRGGKVVARHVGFASKETFEREITPLL